LKKKLGVLSVMTLLVVTLFTLSAFATDAQMYFSSDKNGQNRVTNIQEGDSIWIAIIDNDENIDCDVRDKIWTDVKIMDPKTGVTIIWRSYLTEIGDAADILVGYPDHAPYKGHYPGNAGWLGGDYLEETGADTGVFVSKRAFKVGTRVDFDDPLYGEHHVDPNFNDFIGGNYTYIAAVDEIANPVNLITERAAIFMRNYIGGAWGHPGITEITIPLSMLGWYGTLASVAQALFETPLLERYMLMPGRFENMDSLIGMYQDRNDATDVAVAMMKIIDTEATSAWDQEIYKDGNGSAAITVVDPDENLNCNEVEWVPVFIIVNPGSWNPVTRDPHASPNTFCALLLTGGVLPADGVLGESIGEPIRWYNIYMKNIPGTNMPFPYGPDYEDGYYYMQYPTTTMNVAPEDDIGVYFDTVDDDGFVKVLFHAQETGVNTGVFQLNLNSLLTDLEFDTLNVRDVLVAYYLDPNDGDDFKLATAYIEEKQHSITSFTDENRADKDLYWIGRDPVYVQVIDANANVDPCCPEQVVVHICDPHNEDDTEWLILDETSSNSPVFFTFSGTQLWPVWDALGVGIAGTTGGFQLQLDNWKIEAFNEDEVYARYNDVYYVTDETGLGGIGDASMQTAFPPMISRIRVANDVSFDLMSVADTQVYDGSSVNMFFLDRQGNRVSGYVNSDCVFIEVVDNDQDEDQYRRERIDAFWDGGYNLPHGPWALNEFECDFDPQLEHPFNQLLGDTNIFNNGNWAKLYVLNPRNGRWAPVDLLETGSATGDFVSVICIDLVNVYECVPTLGVLPGDTIVAFYQDPSNHSDSAMISIKVGIGGGGTPPSQQSTTMFVDAEGNEVANYTDADTVYVKVIDPSHAGAALLASAVEIDGVEYDVTPLGAADSFITAALDLGLVAGDEVVATYTDPTDLTDTSADTITVIASVLAIDSFYAGPNPFEGEVTFGFNGTGIASTMTVTIYDLAGGVVYETTLTDVSEITWDGAGLANGAYIYVITATDGTNTFSDTGKVFINR